MFFKKVIFLFIGCFWYMLSGSFAQQQKIADSLSKIYQQNNLGYSTKLSLLHDLSFNEIKDLQKGLAYAEELISLSEKIGDSKYQRIGYYLKGTKKRMMGNLDEALDAYIKSIEIARKHKNSKGEGDAYGAIADIYSEANNYPNALLYYRKAILILRQPQGDSISLASVLLNTGDVFLKSKLYDSALIYSMEAKSIFDKTQYLTGQFYSLGNIGMVYASIGKNDLAESNMNNAISILEESQDYYPICVYLISMADIFKEKGDHKAALNYTLRSLRLAEQHELKQQVADASLKLSILYEKVGNMPEAYKYYKNHIANRDSVTNIESVKKMADLRTNYEVSQKQVEVNMLNQKRQNQKNIVISLAIILLLAVFILFTLLKSNQQKQKAYRILKLQKKQTEIQKAKAEETLSELQQTQKQLIQAAKMASLGELTAGIAHELKNPLNFVNNFSEVSIELLDELSTSGLQKLGATEREDADLILHDLHDNLTKINNHGKRADAIVKGMLQHARATKGKKEPTNINALIDEYLRLSYHGLSVGEKELIPNITSHFDNNINQIELIPHDIGKVLLNLFNNAYYAVIKKKEMNDDGYVPAISVSTKKINSTIEISVKDNGNGIPEKMLDKIFQPFYTTKPAGQGTGLGLSLSYDIIMAHGGDLKVNTKEGEFAEFIIQLPANKNMVE